MNASEDDKMWSNDTSYAPVSIANGDVSIDSLENLLTPHQLMHYPYYLVNVKTVKFTVDRLAVLAIVPSRYGGSKRTTKVFLNANGDILDAHRHINGDCTCSERRTVDMGCIHKVVTLFAAVDAVSGQQNPRVAGIIAATAITSSFIWNNSRMVAKVGNFIRESQENGECHVFGVYPEDLPGKQIIVRWTKKMIGLFNVNYTSTQGTKRARTDHESMITPGKYGCQVTGYDQRTQLHTVNYPQFNYLTYQHRLYGFESVSWSYPVGAASRLDHGEVDDGDDD
jgi:hypothetical protein